MEAGRIEPANAVEELAHRIGRALQGTALSFELMGAAMFGSRARGAAGVESDVDLLVIGGGLPVKRHRRSREIVEIKRLLPDVPLDIMLMTAEEAQDNFRNHNPLFLDIAEDGIVLLDPTRMLANAIRDTRRYVRERGIKREDGGWDFPVELV